MTNFGLQFQLSRYSGSDTDRDLPISIQDWKNLAMEKLDENAWWYIEGGAGSNDTCRLNEERFQHYRIRPRYMRNVENSSIETTILGRKRSSPFIIAPLGAMSIISNNADLMGAEAAEHLDIIFCQSTVSSNSIEEVARHAPKAEKWFQLYPGKDKMIMKSFIQRAEKSGFKAIVVTVDTTMLGWRESDLKNSYLPFLQGHGIANYLTDPYFRKRLRDDPQNDLSEAIMEWLKIYVNPAFDWQYFDEIRSWTNLPVLIKGISSPADVREAFEHKVDGVVISNHGGRQVDGAIATIDALYEITQSGSYEGDLLLDSGIRHAADVMRAFCIGTSGVLIGRPYAYAMAAAGSRGVQRLFEELKGELSLQLALAGFNSLGELSPTDLMKL
ncbi:MAG TPA: alpha-hydroxy-acid oxidizing protein [Thermoplasmataceae archaeon]|nr:alpha-hydroxy-acid oxidizing protein [Thermoplasmatales archaeon AK]HLH86294.1 alpha-hydroxy-acid oxidizing protein [Thermoplasmataceae archaeon]